MNSSIITTLASSEGPHVSLKAEPVFTVFNVTITNSMIYGLIVSLVLLTSLIYAANRVSTKPAKGFTGLVEIGFEFIINLLNGVFNNYNKAIKYAPVFSIFFLFILFSNLSGLLPLVGNGLTVGEGTLLRPFTADLNGTIALSLVGVGFVQILAINELGFKGYFQHFFTDKPQNPINFGIGILEVFGELTRILSLSLRLFLNTAIGEALISIFNYLGKDASTFTVLPIIVFEVLVALIQAYVFTILCATYLALATAHGHEETHGHEESPDSDQQLNKLKPNPGGAL